MTESLNSINKKHSTKSITTCDFSTLYKKLPHDKLKSKLSSIVDFAFKGGKKLVRLSNNGATYWGKKANGGFGFSKSSIKTAINHLIEDCFFNVGIVIIKQAVGITIEIDPPPF